MITKRIILPIILFAFHSITIGQPATLTNSDVIEMVKSGLGETVVSVKIRKSESNFDVSAAALVELKKAGVPDGVILLMIEIQEERTAATPVQPAGYSESGGEETALGPVTPREALARAKTIALAKSSVQPSRQALEKELLKRPEWKALHLTLDRYKETADIYVEIGYVSMSWLTHRYVYRIYDRRSGSVLAAGETTSWGSLAENLARHIARDLAKISRG